MSPRDFLIYRSVSGVMGADFSMHGGTKSSGYFYLGISSRSHSSMDFKDAARHRL